MPDPMSIERHLTWKSRPAVRGVTTTGLPGGSPSTKNGRCSVRLALPIWSTARARAAEDRRAGGRRRVDGPAERGRRPLVEERVLAEHPQRVRAVGEAVERERRRAGLRLGAVELARELRAGLGGEREARRRRCG